MTKYKGSFDKMIEEITRESYVNILEAIDEYSKDDEESLDDVMTTVTAFESLNGIANVYIDNMDDARDEMKTIFFK